MNEKSPARVAAEKAYNAMTHQVMEEIFRSDEDLGNTELWKSRKHEAAQELRKIFKEQGL